MELQFAPIKDPIVAMIEVLDARIPELDNEPDRDRRIKLGEEIKRAAAESANAIDNAIEAQQARIKDGESWVRGSDTQLEGVELVLRDAQFRMQSAADQARKLRDALPELKGAPDDGLSQRMTEQLTTMLAQVAAIRASNAAALDLLAEHRTSLG